MEKSKKKQTEELISKYISLMIGMICIMVGTLHHNIFGLSWKGVPLIILGIILLNTLVWEDKYFKNDKRKKR